MKQYQKPTSTIFELQTENIIASSIIDKTDSMVDNDINALGIQKHPIWDNDLLGNDNHR